MAVMAAASPSPGAGARSGGHPPYKQMILSAISTLKERKGSSRQAIAKYIKANYSGLPPKHHALLTTHIKRLKSKGQIVTVGHSYKLAEASKPEGEKRKPGRPKKEEKKRVGRPKKVAAELILPRGMKPKVVVAGLAEKRKPGRPKRVLGAEVDGGSGEKKRKRGRPPVEKPATEKKKRGRPAKEVPATEKKKPGRLSKEKPATEKRKPGRPPKEKPATEKKKPGRPPKSEPSTGKKKPGRPAKDKTEKQPSTEKRKPGRPPKDVKPVSKEKPEKDASSSGEKRKRGRPAKGSNADVAAEKGSSGTKRRGRPRKSIVT